MEETIQNLKNEFDKLQEKFLKPTIVTPNIKPPVFDSKIFWNYITKRLTMVETLGLTVLRQMITQI